MALWQGYFDGGKPHGRGLHKATDGSLYVGTYQVILLRGWESRFQGLGSTLIQNLCTWAPSR